MAQGEQIGVEVAYALPREQVIVKLEVAAGTRVHEAIQQSGLLQRFAGIDLARDAVGIFGQLTTLDARVQQGDRIEIYRGLVADPKEVRRQRAAGRKSPPT